MDLNRYLPAVVSAVVLLAVFGTLGLLALGWVRDDEAKRWIRRALLLLLLACVGGPFIYIFATRAVEGPSRHDVDRSLQAEQQKELQQRIQNGGH